MKLRKFGTLSFHRHLTNLSKTFIAIVIILLFLVILTFYVSLDQTPGSFWQNGHFGTNKEPFSISYGPLITPDGKETEVIPIIIESKGKQALINLSKGKIDFRDSVYKKLTSGTFDSSQNIFGYSGFKMDDTVLGEILSDPVLAGLPAIKAGPSPSFMSTNASTTSSTNNTDLWTSLSTAKTPFADQFSTLNSQYKKYSDDASNAVNNGYASATSAANSATTKK